MGVNRRKRVDPVPTPMRIGIIGAGRGGMALLRMLRVVPDVTIVGICDIDARAPGMLAAQGLAIPTYPGADEMLAAQELDWLINVSHASLARRLLLNRSIANVRIIDGDVSELVWRILVAFDQEVSDADGETGAQAEHADMLRALIWKVVSDTADVVQQAHDRLAEIAFRDSLTGLYTRRLAIEFLDKEIFNARRNGQSIGLLFLDIDHFKETNDRFGHDAGDEVLRQFARVITAEARAGDLAARYGGEEFAIVLHGSNLEEAAVFAERLRKRVAREVRRPDGIAQTASIGVTACGYGKDGNAAGRREPVGEMRKRLLRIADEALYAAKHAGRNRIVRSALEDSRSPSG